tara:strand:+ start:526 stop:1902 length:1377 start_codon:yes stop_codon:yes gene_type:complete
MIDNMYDMQNYAKNLIKTSIKDQKLLNNKARYNFINKLLDYYQGDNTEKYIKDYFKTTAFKEIPLMSYNVTKRMIDKMSRIYTLGASRTLPTKNDEYQSLTRFKDFKMKHLEKMTKLIGTVAVQVSWKENSQGNHHFEYTPFYKFDVILNPENPLEPSAIIYPMLLPVDDSSTAPDPLYCYWDHQYKIIYKASGLDGSMSEIERYENPYGRIPFVFFHRDHQIDNFFCYPAFDIISVNEMINILFSEMSLGSRFQLFGQYVATGLYQDEKIQRAGSDEIIVMPEGTDLKILSPDVNINDGLKLARGMLELVAQNNHLNISFSETNKDRPSSGIALKIKDLEKFEDYQDDLEIFAHHERALYDLEQTIALVNGFNLPYDIGIDFNEPEYPMMVQDEIAWNTWQLENNMTTKAKLLIKYNKDLSPEQAEQELKENEAANGTKQQTGSIFNRIRNQNTGTE